MIWNNAKLGKRSYAVGLKEQLRLLKHFHLLSCFSFLSELYAQSGFNFNIILNVC